jgi:hypothetical protein
MDRAPKDSSRVSDRADPMTRATREHGGNIVSQSPHQ